MKKFLKAMLAAMLIAITAVTVCSCGVPSDPAKAKEKLGWNPRKTSFQELVNIMVDNDMELIKKQHKA